VAINCSMEAAETSTFHKVIKHILYEVDILAVDVHNIFCSMAAKRVCSHSRKLRIQIVSLFSETPCTIND